MWTWSKTCCIIASKKQKISNSTVDHFFIFIVKWNGLAIYFIVSLPTKRPISSILNLLCANGAFSTYIRNVYACTWEVNKKKKININCRPQTHSPSYFCVRAFAVCLFKLFVLQNRLFQAWKTVHTHTIYNRVVCFELKSIFVFRPTFKFWW